MKTTTILSAALAMTMATACKKKGEVEKGEEKKGETKPATKVGETKTPAKEAPATKEAPSPELLARGEYLANLMGCEQCHTPMGPHGPIADKAWGGGLEIPEVFGTWRSPNISMDEKTGIGSWTDEQIIDAIRLGKRPDGEQLFPIMPYLYYNGLSDDDAVALVAHLRTLPKVENAVERSTDLKLPKIPAPPAKGEAPDKADPVAYGKYLVSAMHCAACHTPMGPMGPDMSKLFAGGMELELPMLGEGKIYSSNLTPDPKTGIGEWSDEELVTAFRQMKKRDGTLILPPMAMYQKGWFSITDEDAAAIVAFLRSLPPIEHEVPANTFKPHEHGAPGEAKPE